MLVYVLLKSGEGELIAVLELAVVFAMLLHGVVGEMHIGIVNIVFVDNEL